MRKHMIRAFDKVDNSIKIFCDECGALIGEEVKQTDYMYADGVCMDVKLDGETNRYDFCSMKCASKFMKDFINLTSKRGS